MKTVITEVSSDTQMRQFGRALAGQILGGEVIELIGDVGAGKTTLVKGLGKGLGVDEKVQSPSFTISRVYEAAANLRLVHYDFYRLADAGILSSELEENQFDKRTVTVIEWADIVEGILPADRLRVRILTTSETSRTIELTAGGETSQRLLGAVK